MGVAAVNPDAKVYVKTLSSWYDPENETAYAQALLDMGCDVIAQHCDTANPQLAAAGAGKFGVGYNSDMSKEAGASTITSVVWNWGVYYTAACRAALECFASDTYDKTPWVEFGNYYGGFKDGLVDIAPLSADAPEGAAECIGIVEELFNNDSWDVFSGEALNFTKGEDGTWSYTTTDRGLTITLGDEPSVTVAAGKNRVDDSVITGTMSWFYDNVEGEAN
jgi:basic membrane protein A